MASKNGSNVLLHLAGELKKAAQLDEQNHPFDYSLTRDTLSAARGSEVTGGGGEGGGGGVASSDGEMSTVSHHSSLNPKPLTMIPTLTSYL